MIPSRTGAVLAGVAFCCAGCAAPDEGPETRPLGEPVLSQSDMELATQDQVSFTDHVQPILEVRCLHCHDGTQAPGTFSLASKEEAMTGGRIIPGNSRSSLLITALTTGNHARSMPAVGDAPPEMEVEILARWIDQGAGWPEGVTLRSKD